METIISHGWIHTGYYSKMNFLPMHLHLHSLLPDY